jgi:hypothetical protein
MHHFAWLRHIVDVCQAARALQKDEEARFAQVTMRTGIRVPAVVGLTLAFRLMAEERCLEIAEGLSTSSEHWIVKLLTKGAAITATTDSWIVYNSWHRYIFRELMRYSALRQRGN